MNCRVGDVVRCGRTVTVEQAVSPSTLARAIRTDTAVGTDPVVAIEGTTPGSVHEYVGCLRPAMGLRTRTALAEAGRSRGVSTPYDDELDRLRERLADLEVESESLAPHRRTVAETSRQVEKLRERVATARGRVRERRETDRPTETAVATLEDAIADLTERETTAVAARQRLDSASARARERRDVRERRFELEDRLANCRRDARAWLVDRLRDEYAETLRTVPGARTYSDPLEASGLDAALAVGRLAALDAPVVLACDRFESPRAASEWLDAPIVRVTAEV